jgi:hypothetical protein
VNGAMINETPAGLCQASRCWRRLSNNRTPSARRGALKAIFISVPLLLALSSSGCTSEQAYGTVQAWQRNQCNQLPDKAEFDRCVSKADTSYDSYQRQRAPKQN